MRGRKVLIACLVACLAAGVAVPARAASLADTIDTCRSSGLGEPFCRGLYQFLRTNGEVCRDATNNSPACSTIDGVTIDERLVAAQEHSWLNKALALQRGLDDTHPLQDELWTHTHNSFNADAYPPTFYGLDANHIYSITDQLRMGVRAIEIDVWYRPTLPNGDPAHGFNALIACHGDDRAIGPVPFKVHIGCGVNDPLLIDRLTEMKRWMDKNPNEFLMLYLENNLPADRAAHALAGQALAKAFGSKIYKTRASCQSLPMDTSRKTLRDTGARIILTGNCSAGKGTSWGALVHERGPRWIEGGLDYGNDFTMARCGADRKKENYAHNWIRHWGDETGLSAAAGEGGDTTPTDVKNEVTCGVNMVGWDNLVPFDQRMVNMVWSWAPKEPISSSSSACASSGSNGRFAAKDCGSSTRTGLVQRAACRMGATWHVTSKAVRWSDGSKECAAEHLGSFAVPWNGYENLHLRNAAGSLSVWLNYRAIGGAWVPHT